MGVLTRIRKREMGALLRRKKKERRDSVFLKVVHPRGYIEIFREPITAGEIMRRYPMHCVARPDFFEFPWIVVRPESLLVPGRVFFLVARCTIDKVLKEKRQEMQSRNLDEDQSAKHSVNRHHGYEESFCDGGDGQDSPFYKYWRELQRRIPQPDQESSFYMDSESPLHGGRPRVTSPEWVELQRVRSCLRKADSDRKKLDLKVSFAAPVVIPGSQRVA